MQLSAAVLAALISQCAPDVSPDTMNALIMTESGANPYVIANVSDGTSKYFKDEKGAIEYAEKLTTENKRFSAGLTQIYSKNFPSLNLTNKTVFDPCTNIKAGAAVLTDNYLKQKEGSSNKKFSALYLCIIRVTNQQDLLKKRNLTTLLIWSELFVTRITISCHQSVKKLMNQK